MELQEIVSAKQTVEDHWLRQPGVTAVDVGYKYVGGQRTNEISIRVHVAEKKADVPADQRVPAEISGVPTDVIERTYELHQMSNRMKVDEITPMADTTTYDPIKGGISIGPCRSVGGYVFAGTLGAIVKDNSNGNPLLLSNFHVMCVDNGWHVGDDQVQPSRVDTGACPGGTVGQIVRATLSSHVDAAVCSLSGRGYACEIVDIGAVNGTATATLGMAVRKRGRTTGLTFGSVDSISLSVNIDYGDGLGIHTLTDQIGLTPDTSHNPKFGDHGDSGSVVVDGSGNVVGLYFAGSPDGTGVANKISNVLAEMNISVCTGGKSRVKDLLDAKHRKLEKLEVKEGKDLVKEHKLELKEQKVEKVEFDGQRKAILDGGGKGIVEGDPGQIKPGPVQITPVQPAPGSTEARLQALEQAVGQLTTFITASQRPDLSGGALSAEQDLGAQDMAAIRERLEKDAADAAATKVAFDSGQGM